MEGVVRHCPDPMCVMECLLKGSTGLPQVPDLEATLVTTSENEIRPVRIEVQIPDAVSVRLLDD